MEFSKRCREEMGEIAWRKVKKRAGKGEKGDVREYVIYVLGFSRSVTRYAWSRSMLKQVGCLKIV